MPIIATGFYFLPTFIAIARGKDYGCLLGFANLLLGWTIIGWIVLMIIVLTPNKETKR